MRAEQLTKPFQCLYVQSVFLGVTLATVKISILLFYRRIFVTTIFKRRVDAMMIVVSGWGISITIVSTLCENDKLSIPTPQAKIPKQ